MNSDNSIILVEDIFNSFQKVPNTVSSLFRKETLTLGKRMHFVCKMLINSEEIHL